MIDNGVRVSSAPRKMQDLQSLRVHSHLNEVNSENMLVDPHLTCVALCEEPPTLASLLAPGATTSFLI